MNIALPSVDVTAVVSAPSDPGVAYVGLRPAGIMITRDAGASWHASEGFQRVPGRRLWRSFTPWPQTAYVQALAVAHDDPDVVLAGIEAGAVLRSDDGGQSWSGHRPGARRDCHALAFHPRDPRWAYEAGGLGAACSRDGGRTWSRPRTGLRPRYCVTLAVDPARTDLWYVAAAPSPRRAYGRGSSKARILRWSGDRWEPLGGGLPEPLRSMPRVLDAPRPNAITARCADGTTWASEDAGERWERTA